MKKHFTLLCFLVLSAANAIAATGGAAMPWDGALQALVDNVSGTVVHLVLIALLVIAGIVWAASEHSQGIKRVSQLVFGGAIAVEAVTVLTNLGLGGAIV
jgi:type IV secretion system protein VirB2